MGPSPVRVHLGLLTVDASLPGCHSLKEKRRVLRGLVDKLRHGASMSVAEVGYQDAHTRTAIAVAFVSAERAEAERVLDGALRTVESREGLVVNDWWLEWR